MSNNASTTGRRAKFGEERAAARRREDYRYGCMAQEKPAQWPDWMQDKTRLPRKPPTRSA